MEQLTSCSLIFLLCNLQSNMCFHHNEIISNESLYMNNRSTGQLTPRIAAAHGEHSKPASKMNVLTASLAQVVMDNKWKVGFVSFSSIVLLSLVLALVFALINKRNHTRRQQLRSASHQPNSRIDNQHNGGDDIEAGVVNQTMDMSSEGIEMRPVPAPRSSLGTRRLKDETPPPSYSKVAMTTPYKIRPCFEAAKRMANLDNSPMAQASAPFE